MVNMSPKDVVLCERWLHFANCLDAARELDDGEKLVMRQNYGLYVFMRKLRVKICALGTWRRLVSSYCGFALARVVKYHAMAYAVDYLGAVCKIQRWNRRLLACSSLKGFLTKMRVNSKMAYYVNQRLGNDKQDVFKGIIVTQDLNLNDTNIICAIKKIRLSEIEKESEILAMKKTLEHGKNENVLRLLALQRTREYMYMALELCDGSLGDSDVFSIGNGILQHPSIKVEICQQLLAGIDHIHSLKVFHRDIKPHNILFKLRRDGKIQIKVADMGIAKVHDPNSTSTAITQAGAGTPNYMPAELLDFDSEASLRIRGDALERVDMFGVGLVLFYILTEGKHPFANWDKNKKMPAYVVQMRIAKREKPDFSELLVKHLEIPNGGTQLAGHLIQKLISHFPMARPSAKSAINHPLFWTSSERLTSITRTYHREDFHQSFMRDNRPFVNPNSDWRNRLGKSLWSSPGTLFHPKMINDREKYSNNVNNNKTREFFYSNSFFDCVRMIRNTDAHFREFSPRHPLMTLLQIQDGRLSSEIREILLGDFVSKNLPEVISLIWDWNEASMARTKNVS